MGGNILSDNRSKDSALNASDAKHQSSSCSQAPVRVAVLGGGSFGTALANIVAMNGHSVCLWFRDEARAAAAQQARENVNYLPGYTLHANLTVTADMKASLSKAAVIVMAVPSVSYREVVKVASQYISSDAIVISATKGIEAPAFTLMSEILEQELVDGVKIGVLSGPNFAKEIVQGHHTGSVIASDHPEVLEVIPSVLSSSTFRVYANQDRYGVELAGALKNIYAIIAGMASALGCGNNTQAMILTRSLTEMGRLASRLGADAITFLGLAGVGDLSLTCGSDLSRNYRVGFAVGRGEDLSKTLAGLGQVAEGVNTLKVVKQKVDELKVYMPLAMGLHAVLFEGKDIPTIVQTLMTGEYSADVEQCK